MTMIYIFRLHAQNDQTNRQALPPHGDVLFESEIYLSEWRAPQRNLIYNHAPTSKLLGDEAAYCLRPPVSIHLGAWGSKSSLLLQPSGCSKGRQTRP
eukprot:5014886-Pleurochrysis_carterae.AAC.1